MNAKNLIIVGMADLNSCKNPGALTTLGLGSCVGIGLYDPNTRIIGMAHCMLPDSTQISNNSNHAKFVDTAVVKLIGDMVRLGASRSSLKAKIAGGAQMFAFNSTNDNMRIGDRNVEATIRMLRQMNIPLMAKETGDTFGRTIELYSDDFRLVVKTIGHGNRVL